MLLNPRIRHLGRPSISKLAAGLVGAVGLCALAVPLAPAQAQVPYLGVDMGNGVGIGIGAPPSAYGMRAASPLEPPPAYPRYHRYHHRYHHRHG
jgi:hypothetical protein